MTVPTLTPPPTPAPNRGMTPSAFSAAADAHVAWQSTNVSEMQTAVTFVDAESTAAEAAATTATTQATNASNSATLASQWATTTGAQVAAIDYSAKEYAIGTAVPAGSAKKWATDALSYKNSAEVAAAAAQAAAGLPTLTGNAGKALLVNSTANGVEWGFIETVPSGAVIAFAGSTPPSGYLKANGAAISRTVYAALFAAIGTTYGAGNGSTTFNLPDLRGEFLRGWDDGRGVDSGRAIGSFQSQSVESHNHNINLYSNTPGQTGTMPDAQFSPGYAGTYGTTYYGGNETRPRNVALLYCIKY